MSLYPGASAAGGEQRVGLLEDIEQSQATGNWHGTELNPADRIVTLAGSCDHSNGVLRNWRRGLKHSGSGALSTIPAKPCD